MIIDAHTHYCACYEERDGEDPSRWLAGLDAEQVDGAVLCGGFRSFWPGGGLAACNDRLARVAARAPQRLAAFGTTHPFCGEEAVPEAERCLGELGMKGIKLHPWLQGFPSLLGPEVQALCRVCEAAGSAILFHDGTSNVSLPSQIAELARAHPGANFILGHGGLLHLWRQAAEAAASIENLYITLCGPHVAALRHVCRVVPPQRILWGSDYGIDFSRAMLSYRKRLIDFAGLSRDGYEAAMGGNAARLLGWGA